MGDYVIVKEGNSYMVKINDWVMYAGDSYSECIQYIYEVLMK